MRKRSAMRIFALMVVAATLMSVFVSATAQQKVLRTQFRTAETGFDPQQRDDRYSVGVMENIFEPLLTYDYLARPVRLVPLTATEVPAAEENGTRYTFKLRPGILFADDPAFGGKKRELVAADIEYSIKRFRDPVNRSPYEWLFENKLVGLDELAAQSKKTGKFDYAAKIEGIRVTDKYTISFKLKEPDYNFLYILAMPNVVPVAREVIEKYGNNTNAHPVGTGPYLLKEWTPRFKIVLEKNPNFRGFTLNEEFADPKDEWDQRAIADLRGKKLPLLDRIEIYPIEEEQPRFLAFMNGDHDVMLETPFAFISQVLPNGKLAENLAKKGVLAFKESQPEITYDAFNVDEKLSPTIGGYTPDKVALRRAMVLAYDNEQEIRIARKGQAMAAQSPVPPGVVGFDPMFRADATQYDPVRAKALLDMYGYVDKNGDGWRDKPDGTPLAVNYKYNARNDENRQLAELFVKCMAAVGLKVTSLPVQFSDLLRDRKVGKFEVGQSAWIADYPDAQNFLQLLYGPNTDQSNDARFRLAAFDRLYEKSLTIPDGPERNALYRDMNRLIVAYAPWRLGVHRVFNHLMYPWVKGFKKHPILYTNYMYLDLDVAARDKALGSR
ncbi:MAG: ABC transporter substrate-binding protein [Burkholderiales bacterium]|nr:ABC transporter substrate-binding protein [Burkholderiales bacterium]